MIDYTKQNVFEWLRSWYDFETPAGLEKGDATTMTWGDYPGYSFDFVASETYLGRPFTAPPSPEILSQTIAECNLIIKKFLQNIYRQVQPGTRFCLAVPAWQIKPNQFKHLPLVDQISKVGYNRVSFEHLRDKDLIYFRPDQIVARQLLVITRK